MTFLSSTTLWHHDGYFLHGTSILMHVPCTIILYSIAARVVATAGLPIDFK